MRSTKFFIAFIILLLSLFLQITALDVFNIWLGFVLAALIAAAFFLSFEELIFLVLFAAFVLNWQPAISFEILVFSAIPIIVYFLKTFVPLQPLLSNLFFISIATLSFHLIFSPGFLIAHPDVAALDFLASLFYGLLTFRLLKLTKTRPLTHDI